MFLHVVLCMALSGGHYETNVMTLIHLSLVPHICVSELVGIGPDNGFSLDRRQAITRINGQLLSVRYIGTNFRDFFYQSAKLFIQGNASEISFAKWQTFFQGEMS